MPSSDLVVQRIARPPVASRVPVFLHSSFRTGSTWLWEKIRCAPTTLAYYEVFHPSLASLRHSEAKAVDFAQWVSRHPSTAPYFLEFVAFLKPDGGVDGYESAMAYERFVPNGGPDGVLTPSEEAYVQKLIVAAQLQQKIPVLSCTRSLGRAAALRRSFGGGAILLCRNLFHQWASYCAQAEVGNSSFLDTIRWTMEPAGHDPYLGKVADWFHLVSPSLPRENLFQVFVLLHLYLLAFAFDASDVVIDCTEIATDVAARRDAEQAISLMIDHPVDLSDVRQVCELPDMGFGWSKGVRDTIEQFAKLIPVDGRSQASSAFVERVKDDAMQEWERFDFYNRRTRIALTQKIDDLATRLDAELGRAGALERESNQRRSHADGLRSEADRLRAEASHLRCEVEDLRTQAGVAQAALERLGAETEALRAASGVLNEEKQSLASQLAEVTRVAAKERDELVQHVACSEAALNESEARRSSLSAEHEASIARAKQQVDEDAERIRDLEQELARLRASFPQRLWRLAAGKKR